MKSTKDMTPQEYNYYDYVINHIAAVKKVWKHADKFLKADMWQDEYTWFNIDALINDHDRSKFLDEEFHGYRMKFFTEKNETDKDLIDKSFELAWNHHQKNNKHHWEYWVIIRKQTMHALPMPFKYVIEMLCDWTAMSIKFKNLPSTWYFDNKDNMILHPYTKSIRTKWIEIFDDIYNGLK